MRKHEVQMKERTIVIIIITMMMILTIVRLLCLVHSCPQAYSLRFPPCPEWPSLRSAHNQNIIMMLGIVAVVVLLMMVMVVVVMVVISDQVH